MQQGPGSHLKEGGSLLILLHFGGEAIELQRHAAEVGQQLVGVGLLGKDTEGTLQLL